MPDISVTPNAPKWATYRGGGSEMFSEYVVAWGYYRGKVIGYVLDNEQKSVVRADSFPNFVRYGG